MTNEELKSLMQKRDFKVSKSNELVQRSRYELSAQQQRAINYVCSKIEPRTDTDRTINSPYMLDYEFNIKDYCVVCGIDYNNGNNYREIKALLKDLRDKSYWLAQPDGSETTIGWFSRVNINKGSGKVSIKLDELMTPYLFDLKERFVSYHLHSILAMKSQYSIRIYELLKSYTFRRSHTFEIDELKKILMVDNVKSYKDFKDFRKKVLDIAQKEINKYTDIKVSYKPIKKGNKVVKLEFQMTYKTGEENSKACVKISEALGDDKNKDIEYTPIQGQVAML